MASRRRAILMAQAIANYFRNQITPFGSAAVDGAVQAYKNLREQQRIVESFGKNFGYGRDRSRSHRKDDRRGVEKRRREARNLQRRLLRERT